MLYTPQMFFDFAAENGIEVKTLCKSRKGRDIPCLEYGSGERHIVLTSRHHACEATGSYVLEGLLCDLHNNPIENTTVFCVPMIDYDGVCDGDQVNHASRMTITGITIPIPRQFTKPPRRSYLCKLYFKKTRRRCSLHA